MISEVIVMKEIEGYEGLYSVTNEGKVWSHRQKKYMVNCGEPENYQIVWLVGKDGKGSSHYVHRLVAKAFIPNPNNYPEVNHIDEHKDHNWDTNLEWCTRQYNLEYSNCRQPKKPVYCIELDKTFPSIRQTSLQLNLLQSNLSSHLSKNIPKSVGGYHFKYSNE